MVVIIPTTRVLADVHAQAWSSVSIVSDERCCADSALIALCQRFRSQVGKSTLAFSKSCLRTCPLQSLARQDPASSRDPTRVCDRRERHTSYCCIVGMCARLYSPPSRLIGPTFFVSNYPSALTRGNVGGRHVALDADFETIFWKLA